MPAHMSMESMEAAILPNLDTSGSHISHAIVETPLVVLCHRRLIVFSVAATMSLVAEVCYAKLMPKLPQLYAVLLRAAVWDCVLVGVLVAQLTEFSYVPAVAGTDSSHFFPLAVLLYHILSFVVCIGNDLLDRMRSNSPSRALHRSLVLKRVLLELAGGTKGSRLALGRASFLVSVGAMWIALRALMQIVDNRWAFSIFIVILFVAYGAAGFAALELRRTLPGHLVQWLCTGWGVQNAILKGPIKLVGVLLLFPFALSVIVAQIWLRAVVFLVWIAVACPCCRLKRNDDVYDAFAREVALPLLQCSFLAFASTLAVLILARVDGRLVGSHYAFACTAALYYTGMLLSWTAPMVLQIKVGFEEALEVTLPNTEDDASQIELLRGSLLDADGGEMHGGAFGGDGAEIEDLKVSYEEIRALLCRERHDHSVEVMQLQDKMKDAELRRKVSQRNLQEVQNFRNELEQKVSQLEIEVAEWRSKCTELGAQLDKVSQKADSPTSYSEASTPKTSPTPSSCPTQPEPEPRSHTSETKKTLVALVPLAPTGDHLSQASSPKHESVTEKNLSCDLVVQSPITESGELLTLARQREQSCGSDMKDVVDRPNIPEMEKEDINNVAFSAIMSAQISPDPCDHVQKQEDEQNEAAITETSREGSLEDSASGSVPVSAGSLSQDEIVTENEDDLVTCVRVPNTHVEMESVLVSQSDEIEDKPYLVDTDMSIASQADFGPGSNPSESAIVLIGTVMNEPDLESDISA